MSISDSTLFGGLKYCVRYGPIQLTPDAASTAIIAIESREKEIERLKIELAIRNETVANLQDELRLYRERGS